MSEQEQLERAVLRALVRELGVDVQRARQSAYVKPVDAARRSTLREKPIWKARTWSQKAGRTGRYSTNGL